MARSLAVLLFFFLSVQPVFAFNINWQERVQRFSRYVDQHAIAQGRRTRNLEVQSKNFNHRVQGYVRALEMRARSFQAKPPALAAQN